MTRVSDKHLEGWASGILWSSNDRPEFRYICAELLAARECIKDLRYLDKDSKALADYDAIEDGE